MKNCKAAGTRRENQVRDHLVSYGWEVRKPRVSLGPADLVARRGARKLLIQVKANKGSPWMHFRKGERDELLNELSFSGGKAALVHWPPYGDCKWYWPHQWPK